VTARPTAASRVVPVEAEIVYRIAVDGIQMNFFSVEKNRLRSDRPRRDHVSVSQDETSSTTKPVACSEALQFELPG
jgi:hypothetical protein